MPSKRGKLNPARSPASGRNKTASGKQSPSGAQPTVPFRWLAPALGIAVLAATACAWGTLCLLFWQGSWQLLYHPATSVTHTPSNVGLAFDEVGFATTAAGEPQLHGWWIPAGPSAHHTALYLHGADGNLGDTVVALARLHAAGLNVFAFDYRGYGQSHFQRPNEERWREDAEWALAHLTGTRHVAAESIVLVGKDLGANLALEMAAAHPELAGVVLNQPPEVPASAIFNDPRARLVPAHLLVRDRFDPITPAANLRIPSLWFYWSLTPNAEEQEAQPEAYRKTPARKTLVWLTNSPDEPKNYADALSRWVDDLPAKN